MLYYILPNEKKRTNLLPSKNNIVVVISDFQLSSLLIQGPPGWYTKLRMI